MESITTSAAARKSPLDALEQTLLATERHGILMETIDDQLRAAIDLAPSPQREEQLEKCWALLWLARDNGTRLHCELSEACERLFAERRGEGGAA